MISERHAKEYCKEDISLIENYEVAVADTTQTWKCHHRAEILPCGIYSQEDLKKFGLFEAQPADRLIFLTPSEHSRLHGYNQSDATRQKIGEAHRGKHHSDATKQKISKSVSEAMRCENHPMYGKHHSDTTKQKMSEAQRGKHFSDATKQKMSEAHRGKPKSDATKKKIGEAKRGMHWWNNDVKNAMAKECPGPEWKRGILQLGQKLPHVEGETLKL